MKYFIILFLSFFIFLPVQADEVIYSQTSLNNYNAYSSKCLSYTYSVPSQYINTYRITKILTNNRSQTISSPSKLYTDIPSSEITYNTIPTYQTWITWTFTNPPIINDNSLIITLCRNSGTATARWYYGTVFSPPNYSLYIYAEPIPEPEPELNTELIQVLNEEMTHNLDLFFYTGLSIIIGAGLGLTIIK